MIVCVASDHAALRLKSAVCAWLAEQGHEVQDLGPHSAESVDYPDYADRVASRVAAGDCPRGVLMCGTGIGMSIAANKVAGIRAALVHDPLTAQLAAAHNDANVLVLGGRLLAPEYACELIAIWLRTPFEARHRPRLDKIARLERQGRGSDAS